MWECRFCRRRVPTELYIFYDTVCDDATNGVRNYYTTPDSSKTKYIRGG